MPLEPLTVPPRGVICPINTPLVRTVGVTSLSVLNAITERTCGLNVPVSLIISRGPNRSNFLQAQRRVGRNESRIHMLSVGDDDLIVTRAVCVLREANEVDVPVAEPNGGIVQHITLFPGAPCRPSPIRMRTAPALVWAVRTAPHVNRQLVSAKM